VKLALGKTYQRLRKIQGIAGQGESTKKKKQKKKRLQRGGRKLIQAIQRGVGPWLGNVITKESKYGCKTEREVQWGRGGREAGRARQNRGYKGLKRGKAEGRWSCLKGVGAGRLSVKKDGAGG